MSASEPVDPIDTYDQQHGRPEATPDKPNLSPNDEWGESLNPVRETPNAAAGLKTVGK